MNSVSNVRVKDFIIKNLREQILSGNFQPGTRLAQEELAKELCVSRIPVREALQILEEQGLIKCLPSRHMVVVEMTRQQLFQIFHTIAQLQYLYGMFIMESDAKTRFKRAVSCWKGSDETAFHRLFSLWLDNDYLSRQFNNMLNTYVEYACSLTDVRRKEASKQLRLVQEAVTDGANQAVLNFLGRYYNLLADILWEERMKHSCRD